MAVIDGKTISSMDIHEILRHLPHRYPFLLIDRVVEYTPGESLVAIKNVSINEPYFQGHFPVRPIMPGVLVIEAMAQATGVLSFKTAQQIPDSNSLYYLAGVDNVRFKTPVEPGDQLLMTVKLVKRRRGVWKYTTKAEVDGKLAAGAELLCAHREITS
jgi:3-hydroxyacyl-[acyl-carrier-protein] dehydratase